MNLEGYFKIEEKDNGYVVTVEAEGNKSELIYGNYCDGIADGVDAIVQGINDEKYEKNAKRRRNQKVKGKIERVKG